MSKFQKILYRVEVALIALLTVAAIVLAVVGVVNTNKSVDSYSYVGSMEMVRAGTAEDEGYSEDDTICKVEYVSEDGEYSCWVTYSYEEWESLEEGKKITAYLYELEDGNIVALDKENASKEDVVPVARDMYAAQMSMVYSAAIAIALVAIGLAVITFWGKFFTPYEKIWFISILVLASIFSIIFPEEDINGINGIWIMVLYLLDTFLNILCELLISKQSKWNFIVSVFVEITEIAVCVLLAYRFATMATTLFFWLPIDIISFINWHKHPDKKEEELTQVRKLSGLAAVLVITGIVVWTVVVGYFLSGLDIVTDLFGGNQVLANVVVYIDACASAVGIANGVFILLRFREQWIAWYICSILEAVINILSGQMVLLVLKVGYLTNTTYGYIKWTKYINSRKQLNEPAKE